MFKRRVSKFIAENSLFSPHHKIIVALSGGADSVALLRVLLELGYTCECAHCNFHLRGEESKRDELFVRHLCNSLSIPLYVVDFDTKAYALQNKLSIEMAARELRYTWFEQLRKEKNADVIAVAHHRDDSVETFLLNLIRGTGINGLKGISPKNGTIVRPLLQESRNNVLDYLQHLQQAYVTDSTNLQDEYMRNKIRLNILPLMQQLNPSVSESIFDTASRLSDVAVLYNKVVHENIAQICEYKGKEIWIDLERIKHIDSQLPLTSLMFELLHPYGFKTAQVKDVCHSIASHSGKRFQSADWELLRDRSHLILRPLVLDNVSKPYLAYEIKDITSDFVIPRDKRTACLDADKVGLPLELRLWRHGDKFTPLGMKGKKLVSDYLTDRKFTLYQKQNQWVLCNDKGIIWLVGERIDHAYRITESSKRILMIRCDGDNLET